MKKVQKGEEIEDWISRAPEKIQPIVEKLMLILSEHPANFYQTVKWSYPWYSHNGSEMFSVSWHKEHAGFQLWNGAHIPNPTGLIEGTGKNGRNIKIKSLDDQEVWNAIDYAIADSISFVERK